MSQNITWLGASYSDVPAVTLPKTGGGTARFTDVTDTTATASDVAQGLYFYTSDGARTAGTASSGGSATYRLDNIVPEQTVTTSETYSRAYGGEIQNYTETPQVGSMYLVTFDGTEYVCEGFLGDSTGYVIGEYRLFTSSTVDRYMSVPFACAYYAADGFNLVTRDTNAHTVKVDKLTFIDDGETFTTKTITENGTYSASSDNADGYSSVTVNVPSGGGGTSMNVQVAQSTTRATSSTYTKLASLTCSKSGTYDVYWDCFRSSTGGTSGSQLYVGGSAYGSANTTFSNHAQTNHLTGVALAANQEVAVYARSRGSNYYAYCGQLTIVQTA